MGIIDATTYNLSCTCGATESQSVVQFGSAYSAGEWQVGKPFKYFLVVWLSGKIDASPSISSAKCRSCGSMPEVSTT